MARNDHTSHWPGNLKAPDQLALSIYQSHLDKMTDHIMREDVDAYLARMAFPYMTRSQGQDFVFDTAQAFRVRVLETARNLKGYGVTTFIRHARHASFDTPDTILGLHVTHLFAGHHRVIDPYENRVKLRRGSDGIWREARSASAIALKTGAFGFIDTHNVNTALPDLDTPQSRHA